MDIQELKSIEEMRSFIMLAENLDPSLVDEEPAAVEPEPAPAPVDLSLVPVVEAVIERMRAIMETSGNDDYDAGFDAASSRWADVLENVLRRCTEGRTHL